MGLVTGKSNNAPKGSSGGGWEFLAVIFYPESKHFPTQIKHRVSSADFPGMHCPLPRQQLLSGKSKANFEPGCGRGGSECWEVIAGRTLSLEIESHTKFSQYSVCSSANKAVCQEEDRTGSAWHLGQVFTVGRAGSHSHC